MNPTNRTVVVTGIGATTPLGGDSASTWEGLVAGTSGVRPSGAGLGRRPGGPYRRADRRGTGRGHSPAAGPPAGPLGAVRADRGPARRGRTPVSPPGRARTTPVDPDRLGAVIASGIGGVTTLLDQYDVLQGEGRTPRLPAHRPDADAERPVRQRRPATSDARAGVHTPVSACASGAEAIGYAIEMIRTGRADVVVAGGTEAAIHPLPIAAFGNMMAMSKNNDDPQGASRPYDIGARRLRPRRGRGRHRPGVGRARRQARRPGLRGGGRPGHLGRRPRHRAAGARAARHRRTPCRTCWTTPTWTRPRSCTSTRTPPRRRPVTWPS